MGNDDFISLRINGQLYIDKTMYVWEMINLSQWVFLSRPRRFGKTLLSSTIQAYFEGRKDLFVGLDIYDKEKEWIKYPVLHFNLSAAKDVEVDDIKNIIGLQLEKYEELYGKNSGEVTPGTRLSGLIQRAYKKTGLKVVLIFDEYDAPLLSHLNNSKDLDRVRTILQEFYGPIKLCTAYERFTFITGITKFSQLSIFSTLNNLTNITMLPQFASACGFTEKEMREQMSDDIASLGEELGKSSEEIHAMLKRRYDGYHFSRKKEDVYNPYSLLKAFALKHLSNFWFESGTPTFIIDTLKKFGTDITTLSGIVATESSFDTPTEGMTTAIPLLYQSGYLTIKDFDPIDESYLLAMPNEEVRIGLMENLSWSVFGLQSDDVKLGFAAKFWRAIRQDDIEFALEELKVYLESLPYVEGFKKKLDEVANFEGFYEWTFYLIFSMLNVYVQTQVKCNHGRIDVVVENADAIYVMELKVNGTAEEALEQIESRRYGVRYLTDGKKVVKVGISFDIESRSVKDWKICSKC